MLFHKNDIFLERNNCANKKYKRLGSSFSLVILRREFFLFFLELSMLNETLKNLIHPTKIKSTNFMNEIFSPISIMCYEFLKFKIIYRCRNLLLYFFFLLFTYTILSAEYLNELE